MILVNKIILTEDYKGGSKYLKGAKKGDTLLVTFDLSDGNIITTIKENGEKFQHYTRDFVRILKKVKYQEILIKLNKKTFITELL